MPSTSRKSRFSFARLLALLAAAAFVITAVPALILFNVQRAAFRAATYEHALSAENFYRQYPALLAGLLQRNLGAELPAFLQRIKPEQWRAVLETLLPPEQLKSMTEDALGQTFAYVNGETQDPQISVVPLKQSLLGPAGVDAAIYILHSQPDCTLDQAAKIFTTLGNEICNPPPAIVDAIRPLLQIELQHVAAALPDKVSMLKDTSNPAMQAHLKTVQDGRSLMQISPLLPLLLLLAITALAVRTLRDLLIWWGWPFLLTGLIGIPVGLLASPVLAWVLQRLIMKNFATILPAEVSGSVRAVAEATLREMLRPVVWQSLVLLLIGLGFVLVSYLFSPRRTSNALASQPATDRL